MYEKNRVCRKCRYLRYLILKSKSTNILLNFNIARHEPRRLRTQFRKCRPRIQSDHVPIIRLALDIFCGTYIADDFSDMHFLDLITLPHHFPSD